MVTRTLLLLSVKKHRCRVELDDSLSRFWQQCTMSDFWEQLLLVVYILCKAALLQSIGLLWTPSIVDTMSLPGLEFAPDDLSFSDSLHGSA